MTTKNNLICALKQAKKILAVCHVSPDGDTLGSAFAFAWAMRQNDCEVTVACSDPCPALYAQMPGADSLLCEVPQDQYDLVLAVDCADRKRMGKLQDWVSQQENLWQIDHHITNTMYAPGYVQDCAATGELMLQLLDEMGLSLQPEVALWLYIAISTDTGHFLFANTTASCMKAAARCVEAGVDVESVAKHLYRTRRLEKTRLIGRMLSKMELYHNGTVCMSVLEKQDFADCGAVPEDTEGLIDELTQIDGVRMVAILRMQTTGMYKASLRARGEGDVAAVAGKFGGGGHVKAAGCTISPQQLEELKRALCDAAGD